MPSSNNNKTDGSNNSSFTLQNDDVPPGMDGFTMQNDDLPPGMGPNVSSSHGVTAHASAPMESQDSNHHSQTPQQQYSNQSSSTASSSSHHHPHTPSSPYYAPPYQMEHFAEEPLEPDIFLGGVGNRLGVVDDDEAPSISEYGPEDAASGFFSDEELGLKPVQVTPVTSPSSSIEAEIEQPSNQESGAGSGGIPTKPGTDEQDDENPNDEEAPVVVGVPLPHLAPDYEASSSSGSAFTKRTFNFLKVLLLVLGVLAVILALYLTNVFDSFLPSDDDSGNDDSSSDSRANPFVGSDGNPTTAVPTPSPVPVNNTSTSPTQSPTTSPSSQPTISPTTSSPASPTTTASPTEPPTESPTSTSADTITTSSPTTSPTTISPTVSPTTASPTTASPTTHAPVSPTSATTNPTGSPTAEETTSQPSPFPTTVPSVAPTTTSPTVSPTMAPTPPPTPNPTGSPTSAETTTQPTVSPTTVPSVAPTTSSPTFSPTMAPTSLFQLYWNDEKAAQAGQNNNPLESHLRNMEFGSSVALSDDGSVMAVASGDGSVQVLEFNSTDWIPRGGPLLGGSIVALSGNGLVLAVGRPEAQKNQGQITTFAYDALQQDWILRGNGNAGGNSLVGNETWVDVNGTIWGGSELGRVLALSFDGNVLVTGEPLWDQQRGRVVRYEYHSQTDEWVVTTGFGPLHTSSPGDRLGTSVSISDKAGTTVAMGSPGALGKNDNRIKGGKVHVYQYNPNDQTTEQVGSAVEGAVNEGIGRRVAIVEGPLLAIQTDTGRVDLYTLNGGGGRFQRRFSTADEVSNNQTYEHLAIGIQNNNGGGGGSQRYTVAMGYVTCEDRDSGDAMPCSNAPKVMRRGWVRLLEARSESINEKKSWKSPTERDLLGETLGKRSAWGLALARNSNVLAIGLPGSEASGVTLSGAVRVLRRSGSS